MNYFFYFFLFIIAIIAISIVVALLHMMRKVPIDKAVKDNIGELESYFGEKNIINDYKIIEYSYQQFHPDKPLKLTLKLSIENYQKIVDLISNPVYQNSILKTKESTKLWDTSKNSFSLKTTSLLGFEESRLLLSIDGINSECIIKYSECYY